MCKDQLGHVHNLRVLDYPDEYSGQQLPLPIFYMAASEFLFIEIQTKHTSKAPRHTLLGRHMLVHYLSIIVFSTILSV